MTLQLIRPTLLESCQQYLFGRSREDYQRVYNEIDEIGPWYVDSPLEVFQEQIKEALDWLEFRIKEMERENGERE